MKIAVLSDIHSNLEALLACLAHARRQGRSNMPFSVTCWAMAPTRWPASK